MFFGEIFFFLLHFSRAGHENRADSIAPKVPAVAWFLESEKGEEKRLKITFIFCNKSFVPVEKIESF